MSPGRTGQHSTWTRFPRVSGDEPGILEALPQLIEFSPRERG